MATTDKRPPHGRFGPLPDGPLSRRQLFPTAIGAVSIAAAAISLGRSSLAVAQSKVTQATAKYQNHPKDGQSCADCNFFRPPRACQLVEGDVSPNGWCSFYAKKP